MNYLNDITDEDFVPFLHGLGVDTYKKSFEWMLNDPDFSEVLRWIYNNLDHNNALYDWEEYRYGEIEKKGNLLSLDKLEREICSIQNEFKGLCLPGDTDSLEDMKLDVTFQNERLTMLDKHVQTLKELLAENEKTKDNLTLDITKLHAAQTQHEEDELAASEESLKLAESVENVTNDVFNIISNTLNLYASCSDDKEVAKRFFVYGPFESYIQSQTLFKSHFDLFTSKKFNQKQNDTSNDEELRMALMEAKNMEEWLSDAVSGYIESKSELCGEQAKLLFITNYTNVHPSQVAVCLIETQSAKELLEQEESILEQQLQNAVKHYVDRRTSLAVEVTAKSALAVREQIYKDLTYLWDITNQALSIDRVLYTALRRELRLVEELSHFSAHLRSYHLQDTDAVACRIKSMNEIRTEQDNMEEHLQSSNVVLRALSDVFGVECNTDKLLPVKLYNELNCNIQTLNGNIYEEYNIKEIFLNKIKESTKPVKDFIYDGCTKQPNCYNRTVSSMMHNLLHHVETVDGIVVGTSGLFNTVKNGDKHNSRKLWQWFLTDPARLMQLIKNMTR